jgi:hypothetical protein
MRYLNLILVFYLWSTVSFAQHWSLVRGDRHPVFVGPSLTYPSVNNAWGSIPDHRVYDFSYDSAIIHSGTDSVFYFKKEVDPFFNTALCGAFSYGINLFSTGWMGNRAIRRPGGVELFFNQSSDTIVIQTAAGIGTIWTMYRYANGDYIEATVAQIMAQTTLNTADSIKMISLQAKTPGGQVITTNLWTGRQIRLSRTFGPDYIFGAWRFPQDTVCMKLMGEQNAKLGTYILTGEEIFDFDIGDEFHYHDQKHPIPFGWGFINQTKLKVISKSILQDTLSYVISRKGKNSIPNQNPVTNFYLYSDTITIKYNITDLKALSEADLRVGTNKTIAPLPLVKFFYVFPTFFSTNHSGFTYSSGPTGAISLTGRMQKTLLGSVLRDTLYPSCGYFIIDFTGVQSTYGKGLGLVSQTSYFTMNVSNDFNMVYYKKGTEVSGVPLVLGTDDQMIKSRKPILVYPQPARSGQLVQADLPEQLIGSTLTIFDVNGREVGVLPPDSNQSSAWVLPALDPGLYLYQMGNDNGHFHRGKLMIHADF